MIIQQSSVSSSAVTFPLPHYRSLYLLNGSFKEIFLSNEAHRLLPLVVVQFRKVFECSVWSQMMDEEHRGESLDSRNHPPLPCEFISNFTG